MILTAVADAARYHALHPRFADAFAWLARNASAPVGRHVVVPDALDAIVDEGTTRAAASGRLESHRANIDIQVNLGGGEVIEWAPLAALTVDTPFAEDNDIAFHRQPSADVLGAFTLAPGHAAIFWPEDAHKPCCHRAGIATAFRKVVFKVRIAR